MIFGHKDVFEATALIERMHQNELAEERAKVAQLESQVARLSALVYGLDEDLRKTKALLAEVNEFLDLEINGKELQIKQMKESK